MEEADAAFIAACDPQTIRDLVAAARRGLEPPVGTKLVLMSDELMAALGADRVEWNEPDEHGWYTPTVYAALHREAGEEETP